MPFGLACYLMLLLNCDVPILEAFDRHVGQAIEELFERPKRRAKFTSSISNFPKNHHLHIWSWSCNAVFSEKEGIWAWWRRW